MQDQPENRQSVSTVTINVGLQRCGHYGLWWHMHCADLASPLNSFILSSCFCFRRRNRKACEKPALVRASHINCHAAVMSVQLCLAFCDILILGMSASPFQLLYVQNFGSQTKTGFHTCPTEAQGVLLMDKILHKAITDLSHDLYGFVSYRWCRISSPAV